MSAATEAPRVIARKKRTGADRAKSAVWHAALLAVLWTALDRPAPALSRRISALRATAQTLMSASLFAQEAFATYYGVKIV